ncbi:hypothetical protein H4R34_000285 [Dimargaris verticillata]|uniref:Uncharacterized protein n=1 Tax=Dimargaris verticillata TaxID=2761393 RepID=A0A9W8B6Z8_9FUNG|nr:hypothetical protein H4R34_000285 [Dimargaris verticillata]
MTSPHNEAVVPSSPLSPSPLGSPGNDAGARLQDALETIRHQNQQLDRAAKYRYQVNSEKQQLLTELHLQKRNLKTMLDEVWSSNSDGEEIRNRTYSLRAHRDPSGLRRSTTYQGDTQRLHVLQRENTDLHARLARAETRLADLEHQHSALLDDNRKSQHRYEHQLAQSQAEHQHAQALLEQAQQDQTKLQAHHRREIDALKTKVDREIHEYHDKAIDQTHRLEELLTQTQKKYTHLEAQLRLVQMQKNTLEANVHELAEEFTVKIARIEELEQLVEMGEHYREQYEEQATAMEVLQAELEDSRARLQLRLTPQPSPANSFSALPGKAATMLRAEYPFVEVSDDEYIQSQGRGLRRPHQQDSRLVRQALSQGSQLATVTPNARSRHPTAEPDTRGRGLTFTTADFLCTQKEELQRETDRLLQTLGDALALHGKRVLKGPLNRWGKSWLGRARSMSQPMGQPRSLPAFARRSTHDRPQTFHETPRSVPNSQPSGNLEDDQNGPNDVLGQAMVAHALMTSLHESSAENHEPSSAPRRSRRKRGGSTKGQRPPAGARARSASPPPPYSRVETLASITALDSTLASSDSGDGLDALPLLTREMLASCDHVFPGLSAWLTTLSAKKLNPTWHSSANALSAPEAQQQRPIATYERLIRWLLRFLVTLYRWFKFICFVICGFALVLLEGPNSGFGKRFVR